MNITLIQISEQNDLKEWQNGLSYYGGKDVRTAFEHLKERELDEFVLIINTDRYILPSWDTLSKLAQADVLHIGLKLPHNNFPSLYDYYQPTWMYSLNAPSDIVSTSWRLTVDCMLIRSQVLDQFCFDGWNIYRSPIALGHDWGYRMLKAGMIIRHDPALAEPITDALQPHQPTATDECSFMFRNTGAKWALWSVLNKCIRPAISLRPLFGLPGASKHRIIDPEYQHTDHTTTAADRNAKVSVFTPTLQRYPYLTEELRQLREQTIPPVQIVITDQTDADKRTHDWLKAFGDLPVVYQPQDEKGQCNAWNYCLQNATGDYVLFLGDDADEIKPDFIEQLLRTMDAFKADVVACNIKEGIFDYPYKQQQVFITDTFPICLVRKSVFEQTGGYDYAFNKGIRADADVAIRIHLNGGLLVLNPTIKIHHHRAPVGGLRHHKQRQITSKTSRESVTQFQLPAFSEIYLFNRYFSKLQVQQMLVLKKMSALSVRGGIGKQLLKLLVALFRYRSLHQKMKQVKAQAIELQKVYPQIPVIRSTQQ